MTETNYEQTLREYLESHVDDRDPRLVAFYMGQIFKEALTNRKKKRRELQSILDNERLRAGI